MSGKKFKFTWEGRDEVDKVEGTGWAQKNMENKLDGYIGIHYV
jgi:hypothetical protein